MVVEIYFMSNDIVILTQDVIALHSEIFSLMKTNTLYFILFIFHVIIQHSPKLSMIECHTIKLQYHNSASIGIKDVFRILVS